MQLSSWFSCKSAINPALSLDLGTIQYSLNSGGKSFFSGQTNNGFGNHNICICAIMRMFVMLPILLKMAKKKLKMALMGEIRLSIHDVRNHLELYIP